MSVCEGLSQAWADSQGPFNMVWVFSGAIEDLTDRTKKSSSDDETSAQLVSFVKGTSIMFAGDPSLRDSVHGCVGRWVRSGFVM